jgi:A/G-specific adenine glycosylase
VFNISNKIVFSHRNLNEKLSKKMIKKNFSAMLLHWFKKHGRKDLPWQQNKTPYRVWVSEIMLQQTQVATVIPYFNRFLKRFPTVEQLAHAKEDEILHYWTGLGYYQRARNLQKAAKKIITDFPSFPDTLDSLQTLPGIGRSTAGAILSIAFEKRASILDGNVKRVLTRLQGITEWPGDKKIEEALWKIADQLTPQKKVADYTQAIMDLGATLCTRQKPHCDECPFKQDCIAHQKGMEGSIPRSKPKKKLPVKTATLLLLRKNVTHILLQKREKKGVWKGLWSLPEIEGHASHQVISDFCRAQFSVNLKKITQGELFRHTFSHYHLDILPMILDLKKSDIILEETHQIWYNLQSSQRIGLPAPVKTLLRQYV